MDDTPNLALPYLAAAQAQKHVTHNEALRMLDAVVQLAVADRTLTAPPSSPPDGERHIVAAGATGVWSGKDGQVAMWRDGAWGFSTPKPGWIAWVSAEAALIVRGASAWSLVTQGVGLLGVNALADATNRLSVAADATLLNHATSGGHQLKLNKAAAGDTGSVLLQTGFSGRAEIGLCGDDDLHVKVSADGSTWREALHLTAATGTARVASFTVSTLPSASAAGAGALAYVSDESSGGVPAFSDGTAWRRVTDRAVVS